MLYKTLLGIIAFIIRVVNGPTHYEYDEDFDPNKSYVVIGPHRSLLDPIFVAMALRPTQIAFIAKKDLLANKFLTWFFTNINIIPVDRDNPGPSTIKDAVRTLKEGNKYVGIFPTGSRYSDEIKPGAVSIAKMGKVELLPVNYQGPIDIKGIFSWKKEHRAKVRVGKPIQLPDVKRLSETDTKAVHQAMQDAFNENDRILDPDYHYDMAAAIAKRDAKRAKKNQ